MVSPCFMTESSILLRASSVIASLLAYVAIVLVSASAFLVILVIDPSAWMGCVAFWGVYLSIHTSAFLLHLCASAVPRLMSCTKLPKNVPLTVLRAVLEQMFWIDIVTSVLLAYAARDWDTTTPNQTVCANRSTKILSPKEWSSRPSSDSLSFCPSSTQTYVFYLPVVTELSLHPSWHRSTGTTWSWHRHYDDEDGGYSQRRCIKSKRVDSSRMFSTGSP